MKKREPPEMLKLGEEPVGVDRSRIRRSRRSKGRRGRDVGLKLIGGLQQSVKLKKRGYNAGQGGQKGRGFSGKAREISGGGRCSITR